MSKVYGPTLSFSEQVHAEKYRGEGESFKEAMSRFAGAVTDSKEHFHGFREPMLDMRFMGGGRTQTAVGSTKNVTPFSCFVSDTIQDSFVHGSGSIMDIAKDAATTMRMGGGNGYGFSTLRPRGDLIKKLMSYSSGPVSFMQIFNSVGICTASSGHRRGAQMGVLRVDHPDIEEFIRAKQPPQEAEPILYMLGQCEPGGTEWHQWHNALQLVFQLTGFNISVAVTDKFMHGLADNKPFQLQFEGTPYREVDPQVLWDTIMRSTWDWAEPGVVFIDTVNKMNNLWYCEDIVACNPCQEQPLPPNGSCLLGSFNLVKYLVTGSEFPQAQFDWGQLEHDIPHVVRAMDNIIDVAKYPLKAQEEEMKNKRRMGLGATGLANALEAMSFSYGSEEFVGVEDQVLSFINNECYKASALLAKEKGPFPLYDADKYLRGKFIQTLDEETRNLIKRYGIRNSHLTSIAPTGTISMCADNVSSGIEPVFSYKQERTVRMANGTVEAEFLDYGYRVFGVKGKRCKDVTIDEHLAVLTCAAKNVDSSVSKTCNVPSDMDWSEFKGLYRRAWENGCKGISTFQEGGKRAGILLSADSDDGASCTFDPASGRKSCE